MSDMNYPNIQVSKPQNPYYQPNIQQQQQPGVQYQYGQQQPVQYVQQPVHYVQQPQHQQQQQYHHQNQETQGFLHTNQPPQDIQQTQKPQKKNNNSTTSQFGERLDYSKPKYQDLWAMIVFYLHIIAVIGIAIYFWIVKLPDATITTVDTSNMGKYSGFYIAGALAFILGLAFGYIWLKIMMCCASTIIKTMLFANIAVWIINIIIGFVNGIMYMIVIGIIGALISGLYTWCVWNRIPFASALLSISSSIIHDNSGLVCLSISDTIIGIIWMFVWISMVSGYVLITETDKINNIVLFLFFVSFFWGSQVWINVTHTTTCGVVANWYFNMDASAPICPAFKRTMTTSFGSVCLGSLIVAILEALRAIIESQSNSNQSFIRCIVVCCLACITRLIEWFNKYAYAQCAIYGTNFITSAKRTWQLFKSHTGLLAIINDDLTSNALLMGSFISFLIGGAISFGVLYIYYNNNKDVDITVMVSASLLFGILSLVLSYEVLYLVASAIIGVFVCFAEDPVALKENHPKEFENITGTKPEINEIVEGNNIVM